MSCRSAQVISATLEALWLLRNGAPLKFSADTEFKKGPMKRFLLSHNISLNERPVRHHNKTGIIERKHRTVKTILERLQHDVTTASDSILLSRAIIEYILWFQLAVSRQAG